MTTAHEARQFLERRDAARRARNLALWRQAQADRRTITDHISRCYRPRKIWFWGSVDDPAHFDGRSDIDIGLEGITDPETYFRLLGDAMERTAFPLDIVQMEKIEPEFRAIIESKGRVAYERN